MQELVYFAGWSSCTAEQQAQKDSAEKIAIILFIALCYIMFYLLRLLGKLDINKKLKLTLGVLLLLIMVPICAGVPLMYALLNSPWCT